MSQARRCHECGAELPSGSLQGLCPKCLLAVGLESRDDEGRSAGSGSEAPTTPHSGSFVPPEPAALAAHFPQLEIIELLGHGGMGAVYKARQPRLDRLVALKVIRPESADTPAFAERFNREAKTLARLSHPQIVAVYDFGEVSISDIATDGPPRAVYYFIMEYVDGANLRQLMRAGELTPQQALAIVPQICDALQFAHNEGVVHRDIKPENILLDKRGRVKIADFGLAKLAGRSAEEFTLTATHQVMGTPRYMAPEQMEGSHAVDHRADIYSLGVVFYEMLTGEVPMGHFEPPSKKVEIDVRLDEVVLRTLAREPERRYQQAGDVKTDVESISHTPQPAGTARPSSAIAADDAQLETIRQQLRLPAIFLLVMGIISVFVVWFMACGVLVSMVLPMLQRARTGQEDANVALMFAAPLLAMYAVRIAMCLTMVIGAVKMLRLTSYGWAVAASVSALLPLAAPIGSSSFSFWPLWLPSLALGMWSLVLLNKPDVKRGFALRKEKAAREQAGPTSAGEPESVRDRVLPPAIFLLITGVGSLVTWGLMAPGLLYGFWRAQADRGEAGLFWFDFSGRTVAIAIAAALLAIPLTMIIGAVKMLRLTSYWWSMAASVAAFSPFPTLVWWPLTLPVGIWSLVVLARPEVKRAFARRSELAAPHAPQARVGTPVAHVQFSVPATKDIASRVIFHFSGLGYRVVDERPNEWVFERGTTLAALYETDIRLAKTTLTVRTTSEDGGRLWVNSHWAVRNPLGLSSITRRDIAKLEAEGRGLEVLLGGGVEDGEQEAPPKVDEAVKTPALLLGIAGGILTFWLMLGLGGVMHERFDEWWPCLVGPVVLIAAISMGQLRAYWLALVGSLLCLPAAILPIWGWFAFGAGVYSLWRLTQSEVREAFRHRALRSESQSNEANAEPPPRGTLGRAWDAWWSERDRWFTGGVQTILGLVFVVCLILFNTFSTKTELHPNATSEPLRETKVQLGLPFSPWLRFVDNPGGKPGFEGGVDLFSWSCAIMLFGFLAWYAMCRIEKSKSTATGDKVRWYNSTGLGMTIALGLWSVWTLFAAVLAYQAVQLAGSHDEKHKSHGAAIEEEVNSSRQQQQLSLTSE